MGLFDSYYDPQTYQSGGSGLIDRLLSQLGTQGQYQPSPGAGRTFDNATFDPSTYAPNQAQPIAVGNYQMPRIGTAQQFVPDPAAMPQNAQPTQGQLPVSARVPQEGVAPQFQLPPQLQAPGNGFGDHLSAGVNGFFGNLHGGLLGSLAGGIGGLVTGQRNNPAGVAQQNVRDQYRALLAAGVPEPKARLAVLNPEYGKNIVPEALSNKQKYIKIGQDGLGREQYGFVDENNQTVNGKPLSAQPQGDTSGGLGNMDLTGADYLASLPKAQANTVQMMVEGKLAPPSSFALSKPYWQNMISAAKNYDPTFDSTAWSGRVAGVKDFSAGKSSEMVRSANQTLHHAGQLLNSFDALNNGDYPLKNWAGNALSEATGSGAPGAVRTNAHAVSTELAKVFKGANLSDAEIHAWEKNLNENLSPEQQRAQIGKMRDLLQGSLDALEEKRLNSMGPMAAEKAGPLIKEDGQRVLRRIDDWIAKGSKGAAPAANGGTTKTGVSWSFE